MWNVIVSEYWGQAYQDLSAQSALYMFVVEQSM